MYTNHMQINQHCRFSQIYTDFSLRQILLNQVHTKNMWLQKKESKQKLLICCNAMKSVPRCLSVTQALQTCHHMQTTNRFSQNYTSLHPDKKRKILDKMHIVPFHSRQEIIFKLTISIINDKLNPHYHYVQNHRRGPQLQQINKIANIISCSNHLAFKRNGPFVIFRLQRLNFCFLVCFVLCLVLWPAIITVRHSSIQCIVHA